MSEREILTVVQPCILCEGDIGVMTIHRDEETGQERIEAEWTDHDCPPMRELVRERQGAAWTAVRQ